MGATSADPDRNTQWKMNYTNITLPGGHIGLELKNYSSDMAGSEKRWSRLTV